VTASSACSAIPANPLQRPAPLPAGTPCDREPDPGDREPDRTIGRTPAELRSDRPRPLV